MPPQTGILLILVAIIGSIAITIIHQQRTKSRHNRAYQTGLTSSQQQQLRQFWPLYQHIPDSQRQRLNSWTNYFLARIPFEACGELQHIPEHAKLLIAAQASLLLSGNPKAPFYPRLRNVLIYPQGYFAPVLDADPLNPEHTEREARLGESWDSGTVVLSLKDALDGARHNEGTNLVLHEFAHQLDSSTPSPGAPQLDPHTRQQWHQHFSEAYRDLQLRIANHQHSSLDPYGATNPAEFFAVAVESYFERSRALRHQYPHIHRLLSHYFQTDPTQW